MKAPLCFALACMGLIASLAAAIDRPAASITLCGAFTSNCQSYAEKCPACKDCSQCGHCASKGGKRSVCWTK